MAVRKILLFSQDETALRKKCAPIRKLAHRERRLIKNLKDTLNAYANGVGLAAPQINVHMRIVVVCLGGSGDGNSKPDPPLALVNPVIAEQGDPQSDFDGCLSFPGLYGETIRPHYLRVVGMDEEGNPFDRVFEGFDAVVVHHEIDHLDGVLFIDRIEQIENLYRIKKTEDGRLIRVPISSMEV
jgi:peptide deformylase